MKTNTKHTPEKLSQLAEKLSRESAMKAAMQIVYGPHGFFPPDCKLPTAESIAKVIEDETDLLWLQSIRLHNSSVPSQTKATGGQGE